jgi:hypothetical protein
MKGRLNSKGRKTCRAGGPPLRFVQRWERWTQPSASRAFNHGSVTSHGFRDFGPDHTLRKPRRVGHPQMETEFSSPELYFPRKVGHPPNGSSGEHASAGQTAGIRPLTCEKNPDFCSIAQQASSIQTQQKAQAAADAAARAQNQAQTKQLTADDVSKGIKAFDSDKGDKNPGRVVKALDTMGKDFTVSGDTLKQGVKESGVEMPKAADKVLGNVESITRTGDKVVITNKGSITIDLLGQVGKTVSFTINESAKGKSGYVGPELQNLKGVGIGLGPFASHPDHWGPE